MSDPRYIDTPIGKAVPAVDIAEMLHYNRSTITKTIRANETLFEGLKVFQTLPSNSGHQAYLCLNHEGVKRVLALIKPGKKRKQFPQFEKFREDLFAKLQQSERLALPAPPETQPIKTELQQAREYAEACGTSPEAFQAAVFRKHGMNEFAEALEAKPALVSGESGWFNPSQLAEMCRGDGPYLDAKMINHYLNNNPQDLQRRPFQYRDNNKLWRLTELGKEHGREYMFRAVGGHEEIRIEWRETILYASGLKKRNV